MTVPNYPYKATAYLEQPYALHRQSIIDWVNRLQQQRARHPVDLMVWHGILSVTLYSQYAEDHTEFVLTWC